MQSVKSFLDLGSSFSLLTGDVASFPRTSRVANTQRMLSQSRAFFFVSFLYFTIGTFYFPNYRIFFQLIFTMRKKTKTKVKQHRSKTKLKYTSDTTEGSI